MDATVFGDYRTVSQAAAELQQTYWTVDYYIKKNEVPTLRVGRARMVRLTDLTGLSRGEKAEEGK